MERKVRTLKRSLINAQGCVAVIVGYFQGPAQVLKVQVNEEGRRQLRLQGLRHCKFNSRRGFAVNAFPALTPLHRM